jgi:diacylglycerol kinase
MQSDECRITRYTYSMAHRRILSFKYAFEGLAVAFKEEPNLIIHLIIGLLAIIAGFYFQLSRTEWFVVIILIGLVFSLELTNSAIETVVDSFTSEAHPGAKYAKDVSAAAVLVASLTALIIAIMIYLPHVLALLP